MPSRRDEDLWDDVHVATADGDMDLQASTGPGDFCLEDVADFTAKVLQPLTPRAHAAGQRGAAEIRRAACGWRDAALSCHHVTGVFSFCDLGQCSSMRRSRPTTPHSAAPRPRRPGRLSPRTG